MTNLLVTFSAEKFSEAFRHDLVLGVVQSNV